MSDKLTGAEATALAILGGGGALLGLTGLLEPPRRGLWSWLNGLSVLFLLGGAAAGAAGLPLPLWTAALLIGTLPFLLAGCREVQPLLLRGLTTLLGRARLQAVLLLVSGPFLAAVWAVHLEHTLPDEPPSPRTHNEIYPPLLPVPFHARTDCGGAVPLWSLPPAGDATPLLQRDEDRLGKALLLKLVRTAPPERGTNCHGWIFCAGHFCVHNADVEQILRENDYEMVSRPRPGDLIVYRDEAGGVLHTGIVRAVLEGVAIIESKWGILGRYLHAPANQVYSPRWEFYRSPREGHLLEIETGENAK
jgi:hypothetical protein